MPTLRLCATSLLFCVLVSPLLAAEPDAVDPDEAFLKREKLPTDNAGLLRYFHNRGLPATDDFTPLIKQLGDDDFDKREEASAALKKAGKAALPALRVALKSDDAEVVRRATLCIEAMKAEKDELEELFDPALIAVRLLARRRPDGATAALLAYLPHTSSPDTEEEIWFALDELVAAAKKLDPALSAALADEAPARRAVAACLVGRYGDGEEKKAVRKLLADPNALVRLRAAQGLLAGKDASGLRTLIDLLGDAPVYLAWQAEELLTFVAGNNRPEKVIYIGTARGRAECKAAWEEWLKIHGSTVDLESVFRTPRRPGMLLSLDSASRVYLSGCDGRPRWTATPGIKITDVRLRLDGPFHSDVTVSVTTNGPYRGWTLSGDNPVLLLDVSGKPKDLKAMEWKVPFKKAYHCFTSGTGHTVVVTDAGIRFVELDGRTRVGRSMVLEDIFTASSRDGRVVFVQGKKDYTACVKELDLQNFALRELLALDERYADGGGCRVEPLRGGGFLLCSPRQKESFREFDGQGKEVRRLPFSPVTSAIELRNRHLLLAESERLIEVDRKNRIVWEALTKWDVLRIRDPFAQVRIGFPPLETPLEQSIVYRVRDLRSDQPAKRREAVQFLRHSGQEILDVLPELTAALRGPDAEVRAGVTEVLMRLGPKLAFALPNLLEALNDPTEETNRLVAKLLREVGPAAVPSLVQAIKEDRRPHVRANALFALVLLDEEAPGAKPIVYATLKDKDARVRLAAAEVVSSRLVPRDAAAVLPLLGLLDDADRDVRQQTLKLLTRHDPMPVAAVGPLRELLKRRDPDLHWQVQQLLGSLGQRDKTVLPLLLEELQDTRHPERRVGAVLALGRMSANGVPAVPALIPLFQKPDGENITQARLLREAAGAALAQLARHDEAALRVLLKGLEENKNLDEDERRELLVEMRSLGPNGKTAIPLLLATVRERGSAATAASQALAGIGEPAVPGLLELLKSDDAETRRLALLSLAQIGPQAQSAVPALSEALRAEAPAVRRQAVVALGSIGPGADKAIPDLLNALKDHEALVRRDAVEALGKVAPDNPQVVAALVALLNDAAAASLRSAAAWSLGGARANGKDAVKPLLDAHARAVAERMGRRFLGRETVLAEVEAGDSVRLEFRPFLQDPGASSLLALRRLGPNATAAVPRLLELVQDEKSDPFERWAAAEALAAIGTDATNVVQVLTTVLKNERTPTVVQVGAVNALARAGSPSKETLQLLETVKAERPRAVRQAARSALERFPRP